MEETTQPVALVDKTSAVEEQALKMAKLLFSNGTGSIMTIFDPIVGAEGSKLKDEKIPYLKGLIRSGKVAGNEIYTAMKKQGDTEDPFILARAYFSAEGVKKADYLTFIKTVTPTHPAVIADFVSMYKELTINDLQLLMKENPGNLKLLEAISKIERTELESRK